jgi:hypothetical protein
MDVSIALSSKVALFLIWQSDRSAKRATAESRNRAVGYLCPICFSPLPVPAPHSQDRTPFLHPAHRTGRHPAPGGNITVSPTKSCATAPFARPDQTERAGWLRETSRSQGMSLCVWRTTSDTAVYGHVFLAEVSLLNKLESSNSRSDGEFSIFGALVA